MTALETPECLCGRPPVPRTDHEIGETVCDKCGKVLGMMQEVPHTADNRSIAPNRANATEIHGGSSSLQRAIRVSRKTDVMGVNISLSIRAGCDKLGLPRSVKQRSIELVSKSRHVLKGRAKENVGAASIYMVCREYAITRTLLEVCDTMGAHYKRTKLAYRAMCMATEQKLPIMSPIGLVTRITSDLGLSEKFSRQSLDMWERINATGLAEGKSPMTLSACAIHMAARSNETKITMKEICKAAGITEAGLRNNTRMFWEKLEGRRSAGRRVKQTTVGSMLHLPKNKLHKMYVGNKMTIKQIGRALDCSPAAVTSKLEKYGIEKRRRGWHSAAKIPKDELERLYVTERRTLADIAKECNCSTVSVRWFLDKYGIESRASRIKTVLPFDVLWNLYVKDGLSQKKIASKLGCSITTVYKNMQCHNIKTRRGGWARKARQAAAT